MRRTYFRTGPLLGTWLPVRVDHVTNVTSGAPLGRILRNSSGHVTGHVTRHFRSRDFLFYLAAPPQIWLELSPYTTLLEELSVEIAPILTILFNKSVTTGIVPSDWRTAHVSPVYEKGQKYNSENYRPISLTCICCKLLEHLIVKHIMSHADTHNILYPLQHGFRTGRSCETQLLEFIDDVPLLWGDILCLSCPSVRLSVCPSVRHTVCQRNSSEANEQNFMKLGM